MRLGIISDTHDFLDPRVKDLFAGVDHILHAGDVGSAWITFELEQIAPVTAVVGNNDYDLNFKETEVVTLAGKKILVQHIVEPSDPDEKLRRAIARHRPDLVVHGHTHRASDVVVGGTRFFNPGYSGRPRFNQDRSLALLQCTAAGITAEFITL
jgi:putative phosphoesterase